MKMFSIDTYIKRRQQLASNIKDGIVVLIGNVDSPMNYAGNCYPFTQDSTFLYYYGVDVPGLIGIIDLNSNRQVIFGNEQTIDEQVWTGPLAPVEELANRAGITETLPLDSLAKELLTASESGRKIHFLPFYRAQNTLRMSSILNISPDKLTSLVSVDLIKAIVNQRSYKSTEEIDQIQEAVNLTAQMQIAAMKLTKPNISEAQIVAQIESVVTAADSRIAFPTIFSIHGETLHNLKHSNIMKDGDIVVNDCGAQSSMHYAGDLTRTIPVSGKFTSKQKEIYQIVLDAQLKGISAIKPGIEFRDIYKISCEQLASGLKDLGLMKGNITEAVQAGAHGLFFQCGLGHMMGLDVHDMENLGEEYVGYTDHIKRSSLFGPKCLRLAKKLETDFVITIEPGIYFIPQLIDLWQSQNKFESFINYDQVQQYRDFGGIRIEDDFLVTDSGYKLLGTHVPKTIEEVQACCNT